MNKKGFTMVELLAVIVILGVLGTIGVVATNKYLVQSREKSYKIMSQTLYEATMNCMAQGKCATPTKTSVVTYRSAKLVELGYVDSMKNPRSSEKDCEGIVTVIDVSDGSDSSEYNNYKYEVQLNCSGVANTTLVWPDEKKNNNKKLISTNDISNDNEINGGTAEKIICKRASVSTLHKEVCNYNTDHTIRDYCKGFGGYSPGENIIYGNVAVYGSFRSGDAFDCDVNGDGNYDYVKERFYYVTDLDSDTAVMIFYTNTEGSSLGNGYSFGTSYGSNTYSGPTDAKKYLPTTSQWPNVSLKNNVRAITTPNDLSYIMVRTDKKNLPTNFSYAGYSARLITYQELLRACSQDDTILNYELGLGNCQYLVENSVYSSNNKMRGYWIENPYPSCYNRWEAMSVDGGGSGWGVKVSSTNGSYTLGVRPVIEVPKKNISFDFN